MAITLRAPVLRVRCRSPAGVLKISTTILAPTIGLQCCQPLIWRQWIVWIQQRVFMNSMEISMLCYRGESDRYLNASVKTFWKRLWVVWLNIPLGLMEISDVISTGWYVYNHVILNIDSLNIKHVFVHSYSVKSFTKLYKNCSNTILRIFRIFSYLLLNKIKNSYLGVEL